MDVGKLGRTPEEIDKLKQDWLRDPAWDIEITEGFEDYYDELLVFRLEHEAAAKAEMLPYTHFADMIGKRDPAFSRPIVDELVYPLVSEGFKGLMFVRRLGDDMQLYVACIWRGSMDSYTAEIDRIAAVLGETHPELTLGGVAIVVDEKNADTWYGFRIDRFFTAKELERGDRFRLEIFDGSDGLRGQAAFERRVSDTLRNTAFKVNQVTFDHDRVAVVLVRED